MQEKKPRYSPTNSKGINILSNFVNEIGWIAREITNNDMGIDMYMEQVVNGNPTARYIAVQLKTGYGNVSINKRNDSFTVKNISEADKEYWDLSSCPVIIVFCDPDDSILYWTLYRPNVNRKTIVISRKSILNKDSLFELNSIIDTYQTPFALTIIDDEDVRNNPEYWSTLLNSCREVVANSNTILNQFHDKYDSSISSSRNILKKSTNLTQKEASSHIRRLSNNISLAMNICRTQFKAQIPIIERTFIEAFSLFRYFSEKFVDTIPGEILDIVKNELNEIKGQIQLSIEQFSEGVNKFTDSESIEYGLRCSEHSFALVLKDYVLTMQRMEKAVLSLLMIFK